MFVGLPSLAGVIVNIIELRTQTIHTSQCLRMAERPLAVDLSGGKTSENSFTKSMTTLAETYAVDIRLSPEFSSLVAAIRVRKQPQGFGRLDLLATD